MNTFRSYKYINNQLYTLPQELMSSRYPSPSYPIFLYEQLTLFKLKALKEGRPYKLASSAQFLETFMERSFTEQNLLCELDLHKMACPMHLHSNPYRYLGYVQLRAFSSFISNHVQCDSSFQTISQNEANFNFWIWSEPQSPRLVFTLQEHRLKSSIKTQQLVKLQEQVISTYVDQISRHQHLDLEGSKHRWQASPSSLKKSDPYCFKNFKQALYRVEGYVDYMKKCGVSQFGLKFLLFHWLHRRIP